MLGSLKIYGAVLGGVVIIGGGAMFNQASDLKKNYTLVDAMVMSVEFDCFIREGKKKVVYKDTNKLAYMPCEIAPLAAAQHGFEDDAITKRATIEYRYESPVDGRRYTGTYERSGKVDHYERGLDIKVHAHKSEPEKSRTSKGNLFIDDTGA